MRTVIQRPLGTFIMLAASAFAAPRAVAQAPAAVSAECAAASGPARGAAADSAPSIRAAAARSDTSHAAVRLIASVHANEVIFARQPRICVRLNGDVRFDSVHVVARRNLGSPVVSGTTYRDVYVAVEILGHLNAACIAARITRSASGTANDANCASLEVRDSSAARSRGASPP